MFSNKYYYSMLLIIHRHRHYYINIMSIIHLRIICLTSAINKLSTVFKYCFFISIILSFNLCWCVKACYNSFNMYICITITESIWPYCCIFKFNLITAMLISIPFLVLNVDDPFVVLSNKFLILWYSIIILCYYINLRSSIIIYLCSGGIYLSVSISSSSFVSVLFFDEVLCNFISNFISNLITSCFCFFCCFFEADLITPVADCLA